MGIRELFLGLLSFLMFSSRLCHVSAAETASPVSAMYVLGDSSVDCGDNTPFYMFSHRNLSLFPCNGSDATLVPHILAKKMGLPNTIPFYSHNGSINGILGGVNFGSAEGTILYPGSRSHQSLNQQLSQCFEIIQLLQLHLGEEVANKFIESSIFYLSFGKDDFIDYFHNSSSPINFKYSPQNFSHVLVQQMTNAVRNLYATNVRKIVCAGVLPLGCAPHMLRLKFDNSTNGSREIEGCLDEVNTQVLEYNTRLEENIVAINAELPGAHIVFCDVYRALMEFINNPKSYGIEDVKDACCGRGKYGGESGCLSTEMACDDPTRRVWWDLSNPTPIINSLLADSAWSGQPLSSICRPITVQELFSV